MGLCPLIQGSAHAWNIFPPLDVMYYILVTKFSFSFCFSSPLKMV